MPSPRERRRARLRAIFARLKQGAKYAGPILVGAAVGVAGHKLYKPLMRANVRQSGLYAGEKAFSPQGLRRLAESAFKMMPKKAPRFKIRVYDPRVLRPEEAFYRSPATRGTTRLNIAKRLRKITDLAERRRIKATYGIEYGRRGTVNISRPSHPGTVAHEMGHGVINARLGERGFTAKVLVKQPPLRLFGTTRRTNIAIGTAVGTQTGITLAPGTEKEKRKYRIAAAAAPLAIVSPAIADEAAATLVGARLLKKTFPKHSFTPVRRLSSGLGSYALHPATASAAGGATALGYGIAFKKKQKPKQKRK